MVAHLRNKSRTIRRQDSRWALALLALACLGLAWSNPASAAPTTAANVPLPDYVVVGWNDLGMHCINPSFKSMAILPPYNNLWVQLVRRGDPPQLVTDPNLGLTVEYSIPNNTQVQGKTDFWQFAPQLFGVDLTPGIGLTGNGLSGKMKWTDDHFEAIGIPLLPYDDDLKWNPYQVASVQVKDATGTLLAQASVVLPVSDEMNCAKCHTDGGDATMNLANGGTGSVEGNILAAHDYYHGPTGVSTQGKSLSANQPVLCTSCHADNALNSAGDPVSKKSVSEAMHGWHQPSDLRCSDVGCYDCHPGAVTQCLRTSIVGMGYTGDTPSCTTCHGPMKQVADSIAAGRRPWLDEPTCQQCHGMNHAAPTDATGHAQLYRHTTDHGGLYCSACHNSPHVWWPSKQPADNSQPSALQGTPRSLGQCEICHTAPQPGQNNPHVQYYTDWGM